MSTNNEIRVLVEWINGDYYYISEHLEEKFPKSFSASGILMTNNQCDASFYVKPKQVNSFISLLNDEMSNFKKKYKRMKYRVGKVDDFYTDCGDIVQNSIPLS